MNQLYSLTLTFFWYSAAVAYQPVKPDNSHNLLAVTVPSGTYSTGVNDALLAAHSISFTPQLFEALPLLAEPAGNLMAPGLSPLRRYSVNHFNRWYSRIRHLYCSFQSKRKHEIYGFRY